jgi:hypothetical protein
LTQTSQTFHATGGTGNVGVNAQSGCGWNATCSASWINVMAGSGTGSGTVTYSVAPNTSTTSRTGTINVAGQTFTVMEAGATSCSFSISPASLSVAAGGGSGSVQVTAPAGCSWTAASNNSWISVTTGGNSVTGSGAVSYSVAANTGTTSRTGTITIGGQTFSVIQAAAAGQCSYSLSATSRTFSSSGGRFSVYVTTGSACGWTATSNASWITIRYGKSGIGYGRVIYEVAAKSNTTPRTGTITVAGITHTVYQK